MMGTALSFPHSSRGLQPRPGPVCSHHALYDDDLGPQRLADGEDVHEAEAEHDEVQRQDDAPGVQCHWDEPGSGQGTTSGSVRQKAEVSKASPCPGVVLGGTGLWRSQAKYIKGDGNIKSKTFVEN